MALSYISKGETEHPSSIVVLLHGSGQNAQAMEPAAAILSKEMPDTLFLIPVAPRVLPHSDGFDWFDPGQIEGGAEKLAFNLKPVLDNLDDLVDTHLQKHGLSDENLAYFGFSLGGMTAMYAAFRRERPSAAVLCHSSIYPVALTPRSQPPTAVVMGDRNIAGIEDDIRDGAYPPSFSYSLSIARLQSQGIPVAEYIVPGLGHTMTGESLRKSAQILRDGLHGAAQIRAAVLPVVKQAGTLIP